MFIIALQLCNTTGCPLPKEKTLSVVYIISNQWFNATTERIFKAE
jgi:hypothetical protein